MIFHTSFFLNPTCSFFFSAIAWLRDYGASPWVLPHIVRGGPTSRPPPGQPPPPPVAAQYFRRRLSAEDAKPESNKRWKIDSGYVLNHVLICICGRMQYACRCAYLHIFIDIWPCKAPSESKSVSNKERMWKSKNNEQSAENCRGQNSNLQPFGCQTSVPTASPRSSYNEWTALPNTYRWNAKRILISSFPWC